MSRERAKHCFAPANALGPQGRGPDHRQALNTKPRADARGFFCLWWLLAESPTGWLLSLHLVGRALLRRLDVYAGHIGFLINRRPGLRYTRVGGSEVAAFFLHRRSAASGNPLHQSSPERVRLGFKDICCLGGRNQPGAGADFPLQLIGVPGRITGKETDLVCRWRLFQYGIDAFGIDAVGHGRGYRPHAGYIGIRLGSL